MEKGNKEVGILEREVVPKKVSIKQIRRSGLPVPEDHDGAYRFTGASEFLCPQFKRGTKELVTGLTPKQERDLEKKLNLPGVSEKLPQGTLSRYNMEFWGKFKIEIPKGGRVFNLEENPWDELSWRVLCAHQEVAKDEDERLINGFARYLLASEEEEAVSANKKFSVKKTAYSKYGNLSSEEQKDFLRVWSHTHKTGNVTVNENTKASMIEAAIGQIIEEEPQEFLDLLQSENYKTRVFFKKCLDKGLINKGRGNKYTLPGGDILGYTLEDTVDFLANPTNQEVVLSLKARLEAGK